MTGKLHPVFATGSVATFVVVNAGAIAMAPQGPRPLLLLCALVSVGFAVQSVRWNPPALTSALLFSLPSIVGLLASQPAIWVFGILGTALLMGAELNTLSRSIRSSVPSEARRRLPHIGLLGVMGLAASMVMAIVGSGPSISGLPAIITSAAALSALGWVMFRARI